MTTCFLHDDWRVIEESGGTESPTVERQYVFGKGIDEALLIFHNDGEAYSAYYYLADPLWTIGECFWPKSVGESVGQDRSFRDAKG